MPSHLGKKLQLLQLLQQKKALRDSAIDQQIPSGVPSVLPQGTAQEDFLPALEFPPDAPINQPAALSIDRVAVQAGELNNNLTRNASLARGVVDIPSTIGTKFDLPPTIPPPRLGGIRIAPSEITERTLSGIDKFFGVPVSPFADPSVPLTEEQQRFEEQGDVTRLASTAGRAASRAAVGVIGFIPNLVERLIKGKTENDLSKKGKTVGNLEAFVDKLPLSNQIKVVVEEAKGVVDLVGNVPAQLDYVLMRAIGQSDPSKGINPDNPLVRAYEDITGKPFKDYYKNAIDKLYSDPESLAFGLGIGKGVFKSLKGKVIGKESTIAEQATGIAIPTKQELVEIKDKSLQKKVADVLETGLAKQELGGIKPKISPKEIVKPPKVKLKDEVPSQPESVFVEPGLGGKHTVSLNKKEIIEIRDALKLDELSKPERQAMVGTLNQAKSENLPSNALDVAREVLDKNSNRTMLTPTEQAGAVLRVGELSNELKIVTEKIAESVEKGDNAKIDLLTNDHNVIIDKIDLLTEASDVSGTAVGRALNIRKLLINKETFDIASVVKKARTTAKRNLEPKELKILRDKVKELETKTGSYKKELKEFEDNRILLEKKLAEKIVTKQVARNLARAKITKQVRVKVKSVKAERSEILGELKGLGFRISAGISPEGLLLVGKLANTYMREGAINLKSLVQKIKTDLPEIVDMDVYRAITAKDPKNIRKARSVAQKQNQLNKTMADLFIQIEDGINKKFREIKKRPPTVPEILELRKKLHALKKDFMKSRAKSPNQRARVEDMLAKLEEQLDGHYRTIRSRKTIPEPEIVKTLERIKEVKKEMALRDRISGYEEQLRTGEFPVESLKVEVRLPDRIQRLKAEESILKRKLRSEIQDLKPTTKVDIAKDIVNTLRTLKATADMSGVLRQGLLLTTTRPAIASRAFAKAFQAMFKELKAEEINNSILNADWHYKRENAKLHLSEIGGKLSKREEFFMSRFLDKPIFRAGGGLRALGSVIRASERHMTTYLNLLRVGSFDHFLKKFPDATNAELTAFADYINVATGRGNLGKFASAGEALGVVFFAPRFSVSRFQAPFKLVQQRKNPRIRNIIAQDLAALGSIGLTVLSLAKMSGLGVGLDPRNADFAKFRLGNTRVDLFGGFKQPMQLLLRPIIAVSDGIGFTGEGLVEREKIIDPWELLQRFTSFKLAPSSSLIRELYTGRTAVFEETTTLGSLGRTVVPIILEDVYAAYLSGGLEESLISFGLNNIGIGANTYKDGYNKTRGKLRKLKSNGNFDEFYKLRSEWNKTNPDRRIVNVRSFAEAVMNQGLLKYDRLLKTDERGAVRFLKKLNIRVQKLREKENRKNQGTN